MCLKDEILGLQDLFIGMEFFGSDPQSPADYCRQLVQRSDLYIGLIGERQGSIEATNKLSFTEIEYRAAAERGIPCLLYLSRRLFSEDGALRSDLKGDQRQFIEKLRKQHMVREFRTAEDLKLLFLRDFIKLLRDGAFTASLQPRSSQIQAEVLHGLTKGFLSEQIRAVAQEKYIPELYTPREAEKVIEVFVRFEEEFRLKANEIGGKLERASRHYGLQDQAREPLSHLYSVVREVDTGQMDGALEKIKDAFHFSETIRFINEINDIAESPPGIHTDLRIREAAGRICQAPFVMAARPVLEYNLGRLKGPLASGYASSSFYADILQMFPSADGQTCVDMILQLELLLQQCRKKCVVLVDKAGTGKTNIACHMAESLIARHPVVLLSGQMEMADEYGIESHIERQLELQLAGIFSDWINRINEGLAKTQQWLFVIIDGINENLNRNLLIRVLDNFLPRTVHRRIRVIMTCRDILWEPFKEHVSPYLFRSPITIDHYTERERRKAVNLYFNRFRIECSLDQEAERMLQDPLLLRFFCEANSGRRLGRVTNIKLLNVFDHYIKRLNASVGERFDVLASELVLQPLLRLAEYMWNKKSIIADRAVLAGIGGHGVSGEQLYTSILAENIILEEQVHAYSVRRRIRFLYDEFMEYILARMLFELIHSRKTDRAKVIAKVLDVLEEFPAGFGAVLFLDQLMSAEGGIVNLFIRTSFQRKRYPSQVQLLYAFDRMDLTQLDPELVAALEEFYQIVKPEYKDRLAYIISRVLFYIPHHPFATKYVSQVLEVPAAIWKKATDKTAEKEEGEPPVAAGEPYKGRPRLPPARYRYQEEARLSAISLLIQRGNKEDFDMIRRGIQQIGRTDINTALKAMEAMDRVDDNFLFLLLGEYAGVKLPEYRIFSAWLLRNRYGKAPAEFLLQLLMDKETRVHQYVFSLFDSRLIEPELLQGLLNKRSPAQSWYLIYFIRLFGKRNQYLPTECEAEMIGPILERLNEYCSHPKASIRLEAYRAGLSFPEYIDKQMIKQSMSADADAYIQAQSSLIR